MSNFPTLGLLGQLFSVPQLVVSHRYRYLLSVFLVILLFVCIQLFFVFLVIPLISKSLAFLSIVDRPGQLRWSLTEKSNVRESVSSVGHITPAQTQHARTTGQKY